MNILVELGILVLAFAYIAYLHIQLSKRDLFIKSLKEAMTKVDPSLKPNDIFKFLQKLNDAPPVGAKPVDHLFDPHVLDFLFDDERNQKLFLHYTRERKVAETILHDGFFFVDSFHKTAENVFNDRIDLTYKHNFRKYYGNYIIIIAISKEMYNFYAQKIKQTPSYQFLVEHILSKTCRENEYILPNKYIKGFIDLTNGEVIANQEFNPEYKPIQ